MRLVTLLILVILASTRSFSQGYTISYSTVGFDDSFEALLEYISSEGSIVLIGSGTLTDYSKPVGLQLTSIYATCFSEIELLDLSTASCGGYTNSNQILVCSGKTVEINFSIAPIISFEVGTTQDYLQGANTVICPDEVIRLVATPGFSSYQWQYQLEGQSWQSFNSGTGNDLSLSLTDIIGNAAETYIDKFANIRYNVEGCSDYSIAPLLNYHFSIKAPIITGVNATGLSCTDGDDAQITSVTLDRLTTGEAILYDLYDSNGLVAQNSDGEFTNLGKGNYTITIQSNGFSYCNSPDSFPFTISNPTQVGFSTSNLVNASCFNEASGGITISPLGGTGLGYNVSIDGGAYTSNLILTSLSQGIHYIAIKDSNDCVYSADITIPGPLAALAATIAINSDYNGATISCPSSSDGVVTISATGGWGSYLFSDTEIGTFTSTNTFDNLGAGQHTFWIKDGGGCTMSTSIELVAPPPLILDRTEITPPQCSGDNAVLNIMASGGTGALSYSIDNITYQTSSQFILPAGAYTIFLKDENYCTTQVADVTVPATNAITFDAVLSDVSCNSGSDGVISFENVTNGLSPYEYSINNGLTFSAEPKFYNIIAGAYDLIIKDNNGCISTTSITLEDPELLSGVISESPISCFGGNNGTLAVVAAGGTGTYSYLWSNGATNSSNSNLPAGNYSLKVIDSNGCESALINYTLVEPEEILVTPIVSDYNEVNVSCGGGDDGSVELLISGGVIASNYNVLWSNSQVGLSLINLSAGEYTATINDDNNCLIEEVILLTEPEMLIITDYNVSMVTCNGGANGAINLFADGGVGNHEFAINGSPFDSISKFDNLSAGEYLINVKDANECQTSIAIEIKEPSAIEVLLDSIQSTNCGQANGSIGVTVSGGRVPYSYEWTNEGNEVVALTEDILSVPAGTYTLNVADSNSCVVQFATNIANSDGPTVQLDSIISTSCADRADGQATISVNGGAKPYKIGWPDGQTGTHATGLAAGILNVTVSDSTGCLSFFEVEIPGKEPLEVNLIVLSPPLCSGDSTGQIEVEGSGGTPPYFFEWSNGLSGFSLVSLNAGSFDLVISDSLGCETFTTISLSEPQALTVKTKVTNPTCQDMSDGKIEFILEGGSPPYNIYLENNLQSSNLIQSLATGTYSFYIEDINGCSESVLVDIPEASPWRITFEDIVICQGQQVEIFAPSGATNNNWYFGTGLISTSSSILVSKEGTYTLKALNGDGCIGQGSFNVTTSDDVLVADFLMSSQAFAGDTIIIIDISNPIPDSTKWNYPQSAKVIESTSSFALLYFEKQGTYQIGLETYLGSCYDYYLAPISILERELLPGGRITSEDNNKIIRVDLYPNPANEFITINTELSSSSMVVVKLISLVTNQVVRERISEENLVHNISLSVNDLAAGNYAMALLAGKEAKVLRLVIH